MFGKGAIHYTRLIFFSTHMCLLLFSRLACSLTSSLIVYCSKWVCQDGQALKAAAGVVDVKLLRLREDTSSSGK